MNLVPKTKVEDCLGLSIFVLKRLGALRTTHSGTLSWNSGANIGYRINVDRFTADWDYAVPYIKLDYTVTDFQGQQRNIGLKFDLSKSYFHFGKPTYRYWFICTCGKRVGVLYKPDNADNFACRHCHKLTYESRNLSGRYKAVGKVINIDDLGELKKSVKRIFYRGELTKRYLKYKKEFDKFCTYYDTYFAIADKRNKGELSRRMGRPFPFPLAGKLGIIKVGARWMKKSITKKEESTKS